MIHILIALALLVAYLLFVLVKPDRKCGKCSKRSHSSRACGRCKGTGRRFRLGAPLIHRGKALAIKYVHERAEIDR